MNDPKHTPVGERVTATLGGVALRSEFEKWCAARSQAIVAALLTTPGTPTVEEMIVWWWSEFEKERADTARRERIRRALYDWGYREDNGEDNVFENMHDPDLYALVDVVDRLMLGD